MQALPALACTVTSIPNQFGVTLKDFRPHVPTRLRFFLRAIVASAQALYYFETFSFLAAAAAPHEVHAVSPPLDTSYIAGVIRITVRFRPGGAPAKSASTEVTASVRMPSLPQGHRCEYEAVAVIQDEPTDFGIRVASIAAMGKQGDKIRVYVRLEGADPDDKPKVVDWHELAARNFAGSLELHPLFIAFLRKQRQMRTLVVQDALRMYGAHDADRLRLVLFS